MSRRPLLYGSVGVMAAPIAAAAARPDLILPAVGVMAAVHAVAALATFNPSSRIWGPLVTDFATRDRQVWLTIDDGPTADTPQFVELLERAGAVATFFVVGRTAERNPGMLARIRAAGHEIGCHTHSHPSGMFWSYPPAAIAREIDGCLRVIDEQTSSTTRLFRAPAGFRNGFTHDVLEAREMICVGWSVRGFDGLASARAEDVVTRVTTGLRPGAIILMHQGHPASVEILRLLLQRLSDGGWSTVLPLRSQTSR